MLDAGIGDAGATAALPALADKGVASPDELRDKWHLVRNCMPLDACRKVDEKLQLAAWLLETGVPEAELDSLVARLAAEMVVSVELLRDCWSELKAALPAVARAKIGAALRGQLWEDGNDDANADAADLPFADGSLNAASQPGALAAAAAGAAAAAAVTAAMAATGGSAATAAAAPSPRRAHPSPAYRALPAASMATGGARPRAGGGTAAPRKRKPSNSLAALREWRNGLSHREPREPQRAQTVNV